MTHSLQPADKKAFQVLEKPFYRARVAYCISLFFAESPFKNRSDSSSSMEFEGLYEKEDRETLYLETMNNLFNWKTCKEKSKLLATTVNKILQEVRQPYPIVQAIKSEMDHFKRIQTLAKAARQNPNAVPHFEEPSALPCLKEWLVSMKSLRDAIIKIGIKFKKNKFDAAFSSQQAAEQVIRDFVRTLTDHIKFLERYSIPLPNRLAHALRTYFSYADSMGSEKGLSPAQKNIATLKLNKAYAEILALSNTYTAPKTCLMFETELLEHTKKWLEDASNPNTADKLRGVFSQFSDAYLKSSYVLRVKDITETPTENEQSSSLSPLLKQ